MSEERQLQELNFTLSETKTPKFKWQLDLLPPQRGLVLFSETRPNFWRRFWLKFLLGWKWEPYSEK